MLTLREVSPARGIYKTSDGQLPRRNRWLAPGAAQSLAAANDEVEGRIIFSGMLRSPAVSLWAAKQKQGVQPPGYSAHNFGLAVDIAVDATLAETGLTYSALLQLMSRHGWYCHRRDGARGFEDWHFNWLGDELEAVAYMAGVVTGIPRTWSLPAERRILHLYAQAFAINANEAQRLLHTLKLYDGEIDGIEGPLTRTALQLFQTQWGLDRTRTLDSKTRRVLVVVGSWPEYVR